MVYVMEKSYDMRKRPKVMEFCDLSWNLTNFAPELYQSCILFVTTKKLSSNLEIPLFFLRFSAKCRECKIGKRDGHGKSRNGHRKVIEIYFVKSVGTLNIETITEYIQMYTPSTVDHAWRVTHQTLDCARTIRAL